ncbi:hypothetical protein [Methylacidimicrobium tartarophylax]|uniref:hypothetical protein n=1 Tax=Methylacidimicrobium tartarophylax TaxID=1041768 RepID=UPI001FE86843|nr:hypothetical protein [Methylacidimicrobium tartarophylax]
MILIEMDQIHRDIVSLGFLPRSLIDPPADDESEAFLGRPVDPERYRRIAQADGGF